MTEKEKGLSGAFKKPQPPSPRRGGDGMKPNGRQEFSNSNLGGVGSPSSGGGGNVSGILGGGSELSGKYFVELPGGQWLDGSIFPLGDLHKIFGHDNVFTYEQMTIAVAGGDPHVVGGGPMMNNASSIAGGSGGGRHGSLFTRLAATTTGSMKSPKPPQGGLLSSPGSRIANNISVGANPSRSPAPSTAKRSTSSHHHMDSDDDDLIGGNTWVDMLQKPLIQRQQIILSELQQHRKSVPLTVSQLSTLRSQSTKSLSPDQISPRLRLLPSLEFCPSAKRFVQERLQLLRSDDFLLHDFMNKVHCIDVAERVERHGGAEHTEEYFLAQNAQREVKHTAFIEEHHHRMVAARMNYVVQWTQRREELVNLNNVIAERSARADNNRSFAGVARAMTRQWLTIVLLYISQHKFKGGLLVGYRKKWHVLARYLMLIHWRNVTRRHKQLLHKFRVNFLLRKLIPRWHRAMKERLREVHMDRVKHFLNLVCHAQRFVRVIRTFMYHVRHAQRIIRRRRVARNLIMTALCIRFDTCNHEMIGDKSVGVYFPHELRNMVVRKLMDIETESWLEDRTERLEMYMQELERMDRILAGKADHPVFEQSLLIEGAMIVAARFPLLARDSCVKSILREFRHGKRLTASDKSSLKTWIGQLYLEVKSFEASWERSLAASHAASSGNMAPAGTPASTTAGRKGKRRSTFEERTSPGQKPLSPAHDRPGTFLTSVPIDRRGSEASPLIMISAADAVEKQEAQDAIASRRNPIEANPTILVTESSISPAALALPAGIQSNMNSSGNFILRVLLRDEARKRVLRSIVTEDRSRSLSRRRSSMTKGSAAAAAAAVARGGGASGAGGIASRPAVVSVKQRLARCSNGTFPLTDPADDCFMLFSAVPLPKFTKRKNLIDKRNMQMLLRLTKDAWISATKQLALDKISAGDLGSTATGSGGVAASTQRLSLVSGGGGGGGGSIVIGGQRKQSMQDRISTDKKVYDLFMETYKKHHGVDGVPQTSEKDLATLELVDLAYLDGFFRRLR